MKNIGSNLGRAVIIAAILFAFPTSRTSAQSPSQPSADAQASAAQFSQSPRIPARVTQSVDDTNRTTLRGNVHRLARAEFDRGAVSDAQPASHVAIMLKRSDEQEAALGQLLEQQQDKSSPNYHKWLTPDQFGKQFGPADSDIQAVTDWLTSRGFTNIKVSPGRTRVEFNGNIGQISSAFQTPIHHFFVNNKMHTANVSDPEIPSALSPVVAGVVSLHDFRPHALSHRLGTFRKTKDTGLVKPLFTFGSCGSTTPCYAVGPGDFAKIYNIPPSINSAAPGTGVTIAIVQDSNINVADVTQFRAMFGLPAMPAIKVTVNGPDPGIQGPDSATDDEIEADLDVQWAGAVAPGAQINLVVSEDSESIGMFGTDISAGFIVDNNLAPILSESFGACEASLGTAGEAFYTALWQQASAEGITAILSAGDSGSAGCDPDGVSSHNQDIANKGIAISGLASTPYNVALGGTDFQNAGAVQNKPAGASAFWNASNTTFGIFTQTSAKGYVPEWPWNDSCAATAVTSSLSTCTSAIDSHSDPSSPSFGIDLVAGGGGPSTINTKPVYQTNINGMPAANFRQVPDISLFSGNGTNASFYVICQQDANTGTGSSTSSCDLNSPFADFQGVGGTSAAAPAFAGIMAMVNQQTGQRQGNANFVLYQLYKNGSPSTICPSSAAPAATCIFYDTILGNNSVACSSGSTNCSTTAAGDFGVLVDPTATTKPAFLTTTGYDNATGLGSVNVTKLLAAWSTANFTSDTVAISCSAPGLTCSSTSAINITHGQNATFKVAVTPTTATGAVSLIASPAGGSAQVGIGAFSQPDQTFTLSGGTATITTNQLPGGTYPVVAHYAGDTTFAPGNSSPVTVTVGKEPSATAVNLITFDSSGNSPTPATSVAYGGSYILQIAVTNMGGDQCSGVVVPCPTGTVTLTDKGIALKDFSGSNTVKLSSIGIAEDQPVQLAPGTHSLSASYSGDSSYTASTSPAKAVTVTAAPTMTTITNSPVFEITTTTPVTITAKVSTNSSGVGPTGSVVFKANGVQIGNAVAVVPTKAAQLDSASFTPAFATATITHTFTTTGNLVLIATYTSGDNNYSSSSGSSLTQITAAGTNPTTTTVTSSATTITTGGMVNLSATVTASTNNSSGVTGTVQFMNGTQPLGTAAACTPKAGTATTAGTCTATLSTALSHLPPGFLKPSRTPRTPPAVAPLAPIICVFALLVFLRTRRNANVPAGRRLAYTFAAILMLASIATAFAGCGGGGSSSTTPTTHVDSITAVYSGDPTYAGSTSAAVAVTISQ